MADIKVVFIHGVSGRIVEVITSYTPPGFTTVALDGGLPEEEQMEAVRNTDFIIVFRAALKDRVIRAATKIRLVQLLSAGYDRMNLKLMKELGIPCANNGGANSWAVADHAVLLMLALYKRLLPADRATRVGHWNQPINGFNTFEMAGKLVGIIGFGNIGRQVARRIQAFDAKVQYYDEYPLPKERQREHSVALVSLDELFRTSDIVTCHTPLTDDTHHLVDARRIASMKPTAVLINTSRGQVVDETALIESLQNGVIAGAGLDVLEEEPVDPHNPLLNMENVVVTPHSAGTTWDTWFRRAEFAYQNIQRVWKGEAPLSIIRDNQG